MLAAWKYSNLSRGLEYLFEEALGLSGDSGRLEPSLVDFSSYRTSIASVHLLLVMFEGLA
jgi:hypothetical protein